MKSVQKSSTTITLLLPSNLRFLSLLFFLTFFIDTPHYEEDGNVVHIPEDFPSFYAKFHVDPEFQIQHVQFPLAGKSPTERWEAKDWEFHKPFNNPDEFRRDVENVGGIITETIIDNNAMFFIVRRFAKLASEWHLIYYEIGTNMDGFVPDEK